MITFLKKICREIARKLTGRENPNPRRLFYAVLVAILLWQLPTILQNTKDFLNPPRVLVTTALGQHIIDKHGISGGIDQKAYLAKITSNNYYLIFELKNDYNIIPSIFFVFDTNLSCEKCFYHTTEFKNIGDRPAENIILDAETFTNKIKIFYQDRRIKTPQDFGGYGKGGIRFEIDNLNINESAQIAYRIDEPQEIVMPTCFINKKFQCIQTAYYYQVIPWNKNSVIFNDSITFNFPENIKEGFYEINLRNKTLTSKPVTIISEKFGIKHFG